MKPVLVVAPCPSHPSHQGNSARVQRLCRIIRSLGHPIHYLYYALEGLTAAQRLAMEREWDLVHTVFPSGAQPAPSLGDHYHLDDFWDARLGEAVRSLSDRWDYAGCMVNYVWLSKAFMSLPQGVPRILDTHDVFGDRHVTARAQGLEPSWYWTSVAEEQRGVGRADVVFAIQDQEAAYFTSLAAKRVEVIGYLSPPVTLPPPLVQDPLPEGRLVLGYLGSANPWNIRSLADFVAELQRRPALADKVRLLVAGSVCRRYEPPAGAPVTLVGRVEEPSDLYRRIAVAINPMLGGTGLKIKTVEALAYGRAQLSTVDGSVGLGNVPTWLACPTISNLCDHLQRWVDDRTQIIAATRTCTALYAAYAADQQQRSDWVLRDLLQGHPS